MTTTRRNLLFTACAVVVALFSVIWWGAGKLDRQEEADSTPGSETLSNQDPERPGRGRWGKTRERGTQKQESPEMQQMIRRLEAIGYASGTAPAPDAARITVHDRGKAYSGFNFYVSGHAPEAILMDMQGTVLHSWFYDYDKLWPESEEPLSDTSQRWMWRRAYLYPNGDILAIHEGVSMLKLDRESNRIWEYTNRPHHDLWVGEEGEIFVLTRKGRMAPEITTEIPILEDFITQLDADGNEIKSVSILRALELGGYEKILAAIRHNVARSSMPRRGDLLHTNSIEILDGSLEQVLPEFKKGNVLISCLKIDTIMVVDLEREEVVWTLEGEFARQHDATMLDNKQMLLFDNRGFAGKSAVRQIDPVSREETWLYHGTEEAPFASKDCGASYRLPNGNTLVVESEYGRAFEVTPDKTVVWEFLNPFRTGPDDQFIAYLYDLVRIGPDFPLGWLEQRSALSSN